MDPKFLTYDWEYRLEIRKRDDKGRVVDYHITVPVKTQPPNLVVQQDRAQRRTLFGKISRLLGNDPKKKRSRWSLTFMSVDQWHEAEEDRLLKALGAHVRELVFAAQDAEQQLKGTTPEADGKAHPERYLARKAEIERTYASEQNPLLSPARREGLACFIQLVMRNALDSGPSGFLEGTTP